MTPDTYVRIAAKRLLDLQREAIHAPAHIGRARRQPDENAGRRQDHRRSAAITRRSAAELTVSSTRTRTLPASSISITHGRSDFGARGAGGGDTAGSGGVMRTGNRRTSAPLSRWAHNAELPGASGKSG